MKYLELFSNILHLDEWNRHTHTRVYPHTYTHIHTHRHSHTYHRYTNDLQERLFENQETNFGILSIEFWTKHYQLDLGKM